MIINSTSTRRLAHAVLFVPVNTPPMIIEHLHYNVASEVVKSVRENADSGYTGCKAHLILMGSRAHQHATQHRAKPISAKRK